MAQSPADINRATQESERIQRQQLLRQQEDIRRSLETGRPPTELEAPMPDMPQGTGTGCRDIRDIEITGAAHMPERTRAAITAPYEGECLGVAEIQAILSEITRFYIEAGYATTRAYLPA